MSAIIIKDLNKYFGANHVLKGLSFDVREKDRLGLLGKNGAGKTTLFKILSEEELYESGSIYISRNSKIGILDQIPIYPDEFTVSDVLKSAFYDIYELIERMTELEKKMGVNSNEVALRRYSAIVNEFETLDGYNIELKYEKICNGLKIDQSMQRKPFNILSGGEKTRVNLGRIMLLNTDILLLDEPTNHLDIMSMEWLEEYLREYKGTVVAISHDRYFLDRSIKRIVEIADGKAEFFEGNYSFYIKEKELRRLSQLEVYENQQKKLKQLNEASKRLHDWASRADNPSLHKQAFAIEKRIERMEKVERPKNEKTLKSDFQKKSFSGSEIIKASNVIKTFGSRRLFDHLSFFVGNSERVGLIGENGCGKTTLLQAFMGETDIDGGEVMIGKSVRYAYLPQIVRFEREDWTVLQTIRNALECSELTARNLLAGFRFIGDDVFKYIEVLSGGEKSRLKLCLLMQQQVNLLILDEPTNHLDISSREWIEEAVDTFEGTILFVSHDRYFINRFATKVCELKNGKINNFYGNYDQFREWKKLNDKQASDSYKSRERKGTKPVRLKKEKSFEERRQELEVKIFEAEKELYEIETEMKENQSNYQLLQELCIKRDEAETIIDSLYNEYN